MSMVKVSLLEKSPLNQSKNRNIDLVDIVLRSCVEQKALDVRGLDLSGLTDIADYFVIASGTSQRHVQGIVDKVKRDLKAKGEKYISVSGTETGEWVLIDYGDFVVHIFYEPTRQYYDLDGLWKKAKELPLTPELEAQARRLRTGIYLNVSS